MENGTGWLVVCGQVVLVIKLTRNLRHKEKGRGGSSWQRRQGLRTSRLITMWLFALSVKRLSVNK